MSRILIIAPSQVDGVQSYGPHDIYFRHGLAKVEDLPWGVESYMREHGYQIDKPVPARPIAEVEAVPVTADDSDAIPATIEPGPDGVPVLVGEQGPELVTLTKPGRIRKAPAK